MLPEPTIPKPPATLSAVSGPWEMTPLFCAPAPLRTPARAAPRAKPRPRTVKPAAGQDTADLLAVTAERLRQALWRSFLRYGVPGDLDATVHAAMNVIEPLLLARDTEIQRLLRLIPAGVDHVSSRRVRPPDRKTRRPRDPGIPNSG
jgi:hypothetical protein